MKNDLCEINLKTTNSKIERGSKNLFVSLTPLLLHFFYIFSLLLQYDSSSHESQRGRHEQTNGHDLCSHEDRSDVPTRSVEYAIILTKKP